MCTGCSAGHWDGVTWILQDDFESYVDTADFKSEWGGSTNRQLSTAHAISGTNSINAASAGSYFSHPLTSATSTVVFAFSFFWTSDHLNAAEGLIHFTEGATHDGFNGQCNVALDATSLTLRNGSSQTTIETTTHSLVEDTWHCLAGVLDIANAGAYRIYLDGVLVLEGTADLVNALGGSPVVGGVTIGIQAGFWVDDVNIGNADSFDEALLCPGKNLIHIIGTKVTATAGNIMAVAVDGNALAADEEKTIYLQALKIKLIGDVEISGGTITGGGSPSDLASLTDVTLTSPADGDVLTYDSGSGKWIDSTPTGGGGGGMFTFTPPVNGDFAWINQGSGSVNVNAESLSLIAPADASAVTNLRIRKKAAPSTPYVITAALLPCMFRENYHSVGLCFRQSSDGKLATLMIEHNSTVNLSVYKFTDAATFSATYTSVGYQDLNAIVFMRLEDNGTNRICSISTDGENFIQVHTVGRTDFLTANEVGFFVQSANTAIPGPVLTVLSWDES